jgi:hypothetical protein
MAKEAPSIQLADDERNLLHATWSRSGKRLIVSVAHRGSWDQSAQVELSPEQVATLRSFLREAGP